MTASALRKWFLELRATAQYGLTYSKDADNLERFARVQAIATEIASRACRVSTDVVERSLSLETGAPSPKLDVRAAVFKDNQILMVRGARDGKWSLPGGWINLHESPAEAAQRVVREQTGYDCRTRKLLAVFDRDKHGRSALLVHVYEVVFVCDVVGGRPASTVEATGVGFFSNEGLPDTSMSPALREQVLDALRHHDDANLATQFDKSVTPPVPAGDQESNAEARVESAGTAQSWSLELQTIAQYGLTHSKDPYDIERFVRLQAIAADIAASPSMADSIAGNEAMSIETGPPSPKLDVRAAVFRKGRVLLVQETADGKWTLPGGWIDLNESPAEAAEREVREESGYECRVRKLFAVLDRRKHPHPRMSTHVYKLFFTCDFVGGLPKSSIETAGVGFFRLDDLPPLSTPRVLPEQIANAFRHYREPDLPTEFD